MGCEGYTSGYRARDRSRRESGDYKDNQVRTNVTPSFTRGEGWRVQKQLENSGSGLNCYGCFLLYYVLGSHGNLDVRGHFAMQLDGH